MIKTANLGAGVNSVAGILKYGVNNYKEIIFADTGSEKPETYEYLTFLIKEKGWPVIIVKSESNETKGKALYDYYLDKKIYPTPAFRDCTGKFKIMPIKKYLRQKYPNDTFLTDVFIDYSEYHRMKTSDVKYQKLNYPLVDDKITRDDCIKIIEDAGYPVPMKSGCFMCPFNNRKLWAWLKLEHPDLFEQALKLEKAGMYNAKGFKKRYIKPLITLKAKEQTSDLFSCACF